MQVVLQPLYKRDIRDWKSNKYWVKMIHSILNTLSFTPSITEIIQCRCNLLSTLVEINVGGESIFWTFRNNFANSRIGNYLKIYSNYMSGCLINIICIFAISRLMSVSIDIKIRNKFIEIKNSISDWFIIFVTNNRRF